MIYNHWKWDLILFWASVAIYFAFWSQFPVGKKRLFYAIFRSVEICDKTEKVLMLEN